MQCFQPSDIVVQLQLKMMAYRKLARELIPTLDMDKDLYGSISFEI